LWLAGLIWLAPAAARSDVVHGAQIPDGAQKVGENRYRPKEDWDALIKYYRTAYPPGQYPRKQIANQPGVKAIHIANPSGKHFQGLNLYAANDDIRIYIVPLGDSIKPKKKVSEAKPTKK
jgi:hypothetical protein